MLTNKFSFRPMLPADLDAVVAVERCCYPSPWQAEQFLEELQNPVSQVDLLTADGQLCGYLCYWLIAGEMQILNLAVAPQWRRQGLAGCLLEQAFERCRAAGLEIAWLEVRAGNLAAIGLYRQYGFEIETTRAEYYRDGEDALLMVRKFN